MHGRALHMIMCVLKVEKMHHKSAGELTGYVAATTAAVD